MSIATRLSQVRNLKLWLLVGLLVFVVRIGFSAAFPPDMEWSDAAIYDSIALNLLDGKGYSTDGVEPTRERPPTYPLFLMVIYGIVGRNLYAVVVVQALLAVGTTYLSAWLATRLFGERAGWIVAGIVATYPGLIYYDTRVLREGPTAFLVLLTLCTALLAAERKQVYFWLPGVCLAVISMNRPETLVLLGPVALILIWGRRPADWVRPMIPVLIPILAVWLPWSIRNKQTFGSWSPVKAGIVSTIWFGSRWAESGGDDQTSESRAALKSDFKQKIDGASDGEFDARFEGELTRDLTARPTWFLQMVGKKAVMFWKDANGVKRTLPKVHPLLPPLLNTYYYSLLLLALFVAILHRRSQTVKILVITILIYAGTYAVLHVRNRYRIPLLPVVFVLSSGGISYLFQAVTSRLNSQTSEAQKPLN